MDGYDASTYGDRFADVYDDWYGDLGDVDACVELVADLAGGERDHRPGGGRGHPHGATVLELGVGTGRLAIPLAGRGVSVTGVDSSPAMLDRLAAKPGGGAVECVLGDMTAPPVGHRRYDVVLVAYNTLFNLVDPADQQRCLTSAGLLLEPGGSVLVEAFVPETAGGADAVATRSITADRVVLSVSRSDPQLQEAMGQYVDITEAGIRLRPWHIRWSTPDQLDEMARAAGLVLADRWADWRGTAFHTDAQAHVSRYAPPAPR